MAKQRILKKDVKVGSVYVVKVSGKLCRVRIDREEPVRHSSVLRSGGKPIRFGGGWWGTNLETNREVRIKSAAKLRLYVPKDSGKSYAKPKATRAAIQPSPAPTGPTTQPATQDSQVQPKGAWQHSLPYPPPAITVRDGESILVTGPVVTVHENGDITTEPNSVRFERVAPSPPAGESVAHSVRSGYELVKARQEAGLAQPPEIAPVGKWGEVVESLERGYTLPSQEQRRQEWNDFLTRLISLEARVDALEKS